MAERVGWACSCSIVVAVRAKLLFAVTGNGFAKRRPRWGYGLQLLRWDDPHPTQLSRCAHQRVGSWTVGSRSSLTSDCPSPSLGRLGLNGHRPPVLRSQYYARPPGLPYPRHSRTQRNYDRGLDYSPPRFFHFFNTISRFNRDSRSRKKMPFNWSISCCAMRAGRPSKRRCWRVSVSSSQAISAA